MEKVYLLLRNNRESGPYTIGELRQQNLQPSDLIWIEGESNAWCYPSEVEALNAHGGNRKTANPAPATVVPQPVAFGKKQIHADDIEQQAEALRKRALSYSPIKPWHHYKTTADRNHNNGPAFYRPEDDQIEIVIHRKEKNYVPAQLMAAAVLTVLAVMVWNYRGMLIPVKQAVESVAAKAATFHTVTAEPQIQPAATAAMTITDVPQAETVLTADNQVTVARNKPVQSHQQISRQQKIIVSDPKVSVAITEEKLPPLKSETITAPEPIAVKKTEAVVQAQAVPEQKTETVSAEPEKKKTIGQAIKGLFKKKKRDDEKPAVDPDQNG